MIRSRYRRIVWFFAGVTASLIWWDVLLPRIGLRGLSRRTRPERLKRIARRFRLMAVRMGGVMIKVGQFLSARLDVLPKEITDELSGLQDEVQPDPFAAIRKVLESELGSIQEHFIEFTPEAIASASIGQVHRARIRDAEGSPLEVVVKVQRPNIQKIVDTDLAALRVVTRWAEWYGPIRRRVSMPALVEEFTRILYEEMDYLNEGKNGERFAENFADCPEVRVPRIYWSHTTKRALTMEEIAAIKITDYAGIDAAGLSRATVAHRLFDTYLKQIFEDRFFHADPHPGNLFVLPVEAGLAADGWKLVFVDFGMAGEVTQSQFAGLREALFAAGTRDGARLVRAFQMMGVLLPNANTDLLEKATQRVFERFWGKSTTEIVNVGYEEKVEFLKEFGSLLYEMPFQLPENLILLGRCMGILSGICTGLDPDFNVWDKIMPYAQSLIEAEVSDPGLWLKEIGSIVQTLAALPRRTEAVLERIEQGRLEVQFPEIKSLVQKLEYSVHRLAGAVLVAALLLVSVQLYLAKESNLAIAGLAAAVLALLWMLAGR